MDIVDLGASGQAGPGHLGSRFSARRRIGADQFAALAMALGFILVLASQWFGWFSISFKPGPLENLNASPGRLDTSFGLPDSGSSLQTPYYLVWLMVFVCCGVWLFMPRPRRDLWLGAIAGALVTQAIILLPIIHRPSLLLGDGIAGFEPSLIFGHKAGSYLVIAALVVIAAGLVVALVSRLRHPDTGAREASSGSPAHPVDPPARASMHDALRAASPVNEAVPDIEFGVAPQAGASGVGRNGEAIDHSMYARPAETAFGD